MYTDIHVTWRMRIKSLCMPASLLWGLHHRFLMGCPILFRLFHTKCFLRLFVFFTWNIQCVINCTPQSKSEHNSPVAITFNSCPRGDAKRGVSVSCVCLCGTYIFPLTVEKRQWSRNLKFLVLFLSKVWLCRYLLSVRLLCTAQRCQEILVLTISSCSTVT